MTKIILEILKTIIEIKSDFMTQTTKELEEKAKTIYDKTLKMIQGYKVRDTAMFEYATMRMIQAIYWQNKVLIKLLEELLEK